MVVIIYSSIASRDLENIYNYIARDSKHYAKLEVKLIREFVRKLKSNVLMGKNFERSDESVREMVFKNYRIIYEVISPIQVTILTIHHHARSISNNPAFSDED